MGLLEPVYTILQHEKGGLMKAVFLNIGKKILPYILAGLIGSVASQYGVNPIVAKEIIHAVADAIGN